MVIKENSAGTELHNRNNTIATGFDQNQTPARTINVALELLFNTLSIHKLINKLIHTNIPNTITKFIANYINPLNTASLALKLLERYTNDSECVHHWLPIKFINEK